MSLGKEQPPRLKRPRHPMPAEIEQGLIERGLMDRSLPPYQQNDYIGWITRAKRKETQQKRSDQMLEELASGDLLYEHAL